MASRGVAGRLSLALALVLALAFGLIGFLAYEKHRKAYAGLVQARIGAVALDLAARVDAGLNMGLPLSAMSNLQEMFQREAAGDADILSIDAFDARGRILYSSDPARIGTQAPAEWPRAAAASRQWRIEGGAEFVAGVSARNSFDSLEGGLVLRYARRAFEEDLQAVARGLAGRLLAVFAASAAMVAFGARLLVRGTPA
jgi:hypothetical protein